ncbi:MAG TPA: hypothetical protein VHT34_11770 [Clostridia bacterium]|nr:hypothetical protein [Clostridia bacterium]
MKVRIAASVILISMFLITGCSEVEIGPKRQATEYSEKLFELDKSLELSFESDSGNIEFYSWGKKQIKFEITKLIRGIGTTEELQDKLANFVIQTSSKDSSIYFSSRYKGRINNPADKSTDVKIYLPKKVKSISLALDVGKVNFYDDIACNLDIKMDMANIDINRFEGKINLKGDMGNLRIGGGRLSGESTVDVNMGNIDIKSIYDVNGNSSFSTKLGNILLQFSKKSRISIESIGDLKQNDFINSKYLSKVRVESGMGKIEIKEY